MVAIDFSKLYLSEYAVFDEDQERWFLKGNAPQDLVELYRRHLEIEEEEKRTGKRIF